MSRTVRIDLAYDGTDFHGWQIQPGLRTVQGELSRLLAKLLGRGAVPTGAGRTDAGVHALGQVAHVAGLNTDEAQRVCRALSAMAPGDLDIRAVREVSPSFDARFSARWRHYAYRLGFRRDIFRRRAEWQVNRDLDRAALDAAAAHVPGERDFSSFCKTASLRENNRCDVRLCRFDWADDSAIFQIRADRFLHHMVRTLVGTLVEVGCGQREPADMIAILTARDRRAAGSMAPPHGLYLAAVGYPQQLDDPAYTDPGDDPGVER
ncbi:tRNA pseudouridine(38-40) synthase TruA [bacterium]|nr:tRNA pseudouridine(38-40) synthase TruA [bacterium]MBU1071988.1 tRNA pseudouridine(38-40) synthase TruA [bacterium]